MPLYSDHNYYYGSSQPPSYYLSSSPYTSATSRISSPYSFSYLSPVSSMMSSNPMPRGLRSYSPMLSSISESVSPLMQRRDMSSHRNSPRHLAGKTYFRQPRPMIIDTDNINVARKSKQTNDNEESTPGVISRGRTTVRMQTRKPKENPELKKKKSQAEMLIEKYLIKEKPIKEEDSPKRKRIWEEREQEIENAEGAKSGILKRTNTIKSVYPAVEQKTTEQTTEKVPLRKVSLETDVVLFPQRKMSIDSELLKEEAALFDCMILEELGPTNKKELIVENNNSENTATQNKNKRAALPYVRKKSSSNSKLDDGNVPKVKRKPNNNKKSSKDLPLDEVKASEDLKLNDLNQTETLNKANKQRSTKKKKRISGPLKFKIDSLHVEEKSSPKLLRKFKYEVIIEEGNLGNRVSVKKPQLPINDFSDVCQENIPKVTQEVNFSDNIQSSCKTSPKDSFKDLASDIRHLDKTCDKKCDKYSTQNIKSNQESELADVAIDCIDSQLNTIKNKTECEKEDGSLTGTEPNTNKLKNKRFLERQFSTDSSSQVDTNFGLDKKEQPKSSSYIKANFNENLLSGHKSNKNTPDVVLCQENKSLELNMKLKQEKSFNESVNLATIPVKENKIIKEESSDLSDNRSVDKTKEVEITKDSEQVSKTSNTYLETPKLRKKDRISEMSKNALPNKSRTALELQKKFTPQQSIKKTNDLQNKLSLDMSQDSNDPCQKHDNVVSTQHIENQEMLGDSNKNVVIDDKIEVAGQLDNLALQYKSNEIPNKNEVSQPTVEIVKTDISNETTFKKQKVEQNTDSNESLIQPLSPKLAISKNNMKKDVVLKSTYDKVELRNDYCKNKSLPKSNIGSNTNIEKSNEILPKPNKTISEANEPSETVVTKLKKDIKTIAGKAVTNSNLNLAKQIDSEKLSAAKHSCNKTLELASKLSNEKLVKSEVDKKECLAIDNSYLSKDSKRMQNSNNSNKLTSKEISVINPENTQHQNKEVETLKVLPEKEVKHDSEFSNPIQQTHKYKELFNKEEQFVKSKITQSKTSSKESENNKKLNSTKHIKGFKINEIKKESELPVIDSKQSESNLENNLENMGKPQIITAMQSTKLWLTDNNPSVSNKEGEIEIDIKVETKEIKEETLVALETKFSKEVVIKESKKKRLKSESDATDEIESNTKNIGDIKTTENNIKTSIKSKSLIESKAEKSSRKKKKSNEKNSSKKKTNAKSPKKTKTSVIETKSEILVVTQCSEVEKEATSTSTEKSLELSKQSTRLMHFINKCMRLSADDENLSVEMSEEDVSSSSDDTSDSEYTSDSEDDTSDDDTSECDVNCHRKCENLMPNLCGVNQKLIVEALSSVRKGSTESRDHGSPTRHHSNAALRLDEEKNNSIQHFPGRVTPPATTIPKFRKYTMDDFQFLKVLGKGSFGKVLLAELRGTQYYYAVKCLKKDVVLEDDDVECTLIERKVLALGTNHPYLCHLFCTFQTDSHLFFVMEYLNGGDLMFHIQQQGRFDEGRARFYAAEIVSGLKFLHKKGIVYRDLKLDNILLDFDGHVRIADFGMCKLQIYLDRTADTFCGTPDYMAPEIIKGMKYNQCVDWWSFGILLYEMLVGQSPFSGCDEDDLFWCICNRQPHYPRFITLEAKRILTELLEKDASKRLGSCENGATAVMGHAFFDGLNWDRLEQRDLQPPFKPNVKHPLDVHYFDKHFTTERACLTPIDPSILQSMDQTQFHGFSYTNPNVTD